MKTDRLFRVLLGLGLAAILLIVGLGRVARAGDIPEEVRQTLAEIRQVKGDLKSAPGNKELQKKLKELQEKLANLKKTVQQIGTPQAQAKVEYEEAYDEELETGDAYQKAQAAFDKEVRLAKALKRDPEKDPDVQRAKLKRDQARLRYLDAWKKVIGAQEKAKAQGGAQQPPQGKQKSPYTKAGPWPGADTPALPKQQTSQTAPPLAPAPPPMLAGGTTRMELASSIPPGFKHANMPGPDVSKNVPCTFRHQTQGELRSRYVGAADAPACHVKVLHEKNTQHRYVEPDRPRNTPPDWVHAKEDGRDYSTYVPPGFIHEKGGASHSQYLFKVPPKVQPPPILPPGTKHADQPGPFLSKPVPVSWFHANKHGPIPGQDLFSHYLPPNYQHETKGQLATAYLPGTVPPAVQQPTKHADKQGPQKSRQVPANYKHIAEGPDQSKYVPPDWKHMAEKGPDQSRYAPPNYEHVKTGAYKSHYVPPSVRRR